MAVLSADTKERAASFMVASSNDVEAGEYWQLTESSFFFALFSVQRVLREEPL